jgi:GT2 family glycosyltransferase
VGAADVVAAVDAALGDRLAAHLAGDGLPEAPLGLGGVPAPAEPLCWSSASPHLREPPVTVIVCTRDRPASLQTCLRSILALREPCEVIVVDNAPRTDATADVVRKLDDPRLRRVAEPQPGLSRARNRGAREARGHVMAFTDDDVVVDRNWLRAIRVGFGRGPEVACVTGMVAPGEIETPAQAIFETKVAWPASFTPRRFDLETNRLAHPLYPFMPGVFGAGVNFAVARDAWRVIGDFDEALGAGSPAKGGEDLDFFLRVILSGYAIAYEPAALVWHLHRQDEDELRRQLHGYGSGLSAFATKQLLSRRTALPAIRRVPHGLARVAASRRPDSDLRIPPRLIAEEIVGLIAGPLAYLRGTRRARRQDHVQPAVRDLHAAGGQE